MIWRQLLCGGLCLLMTLSAVRAQEPAAAPAETEARPLASDQEALTLRYQRFENTLLQLAEYLRKTDPTRADLLVRAIGRSKESRIPDQMQQLVQLLKQEQLGDAIEQQESVTQHMLALLDLLQSEDRKDELEAEKKRIQELIKDVDKLIGREKDVRAATERGRLGEGTEQEQERVGDATQKLIDKIKEQDASRNAKNDRQSGKSGDQKSDAGKPPGDQSPMPDGEKSLDGKESPDGKTEDGKAKEGEKPGEKPGEKSPKPGQSRPGEKSPMDKSGKPPGESKPSESKPAEGESKPAESGSKSKPSESKPSKSQSGKPQPGQKPQPQPQGETPEQQPQEGEPQPQENDSSQDPLQARQTSGKQEIEKARDRMERAIEELKKKDKDKASDRQDEAIAELTKAKEKLEEILRQLREEERTLLLAALEARFRDMLARQQTVYNGTLGVAQAPESQRNERHRNRSVELGRSEEEIALLADKALTLLKEEGSSVAFPEAIEQLRDDMRSVARRLERTDVAEITQGMERDIMETLEELIASLQKELEKLKDKKQQPQQQQQQQQQEQGLVDALAELKMLRSLQFRVNRRTKQLGRLVDGEQAAEQEVLIELQKLSLRQARIQEATHSLAAGKNR